MATVSGTTVTIRGAGNTVITASQSGNGGWSAATTVQQTLVVDAKPLTITGLAAVNKVYDASPVVALTGVPILNDVLSEGTVSVSGGTGNCISSSVGTAFPVTVSGLILSGASAANYSLIAPSNLTVNINYTLTFQGASFTITTPYNPPASYYTAANGRISAGLGASLNTIVKTGFRSIPYGTGSSTGSSGIVPVMKNLYEDPANPNNFILIYGGQSFAKSAFGTSVSTVWNREHCWPQSFGAATGYAQSDLFHMRPTINHTIDGSARIGRS